MEIKYWHYRLGLLRRYISILPKIYGSKCEASWTWEKKSWNQLDRRLDY